MASTPLAATVPFMTLAGSPRAVAPFLRLRDGAGRTAPIVKAGRRPMTVRTNVTDEDGRLLRTATQDQAVLA